MKTIINIVNQIATTSSTKQKEQILKDNQHNELLKQVLEYCYNPSKVYGIAKKSLATPTQATCKFTSVFELLDWLQTVNRSSETVDVTNAFLNSVEDDLKELYTKIILKDLRCGISEKTILKVFPKLFYLHQVQQAYPMKDNNMPKVAEWFALQEKLNGTRGDYLPTHNAILSRQGIAFNGMGHIVKEIKDLFGDTYVVDGELIRNNVNNLSDEENFTLSCSIINTQDNTIEKTDIIFIVYDIIPMGEFLNEKSKKLFRDRYKDLMKFEEIAKEKGIKYIKFSHNLYEGTDQSKIQEWLDEMDRQGKEGLMLYKNDYYKCKRHNGLLKVKSFLSCDVECIGIYEGEGKYKGMLGGIIVDYKGYEVGVGSGFDDHTRQYLWEHPSEIVGKIVQVKYKAETKNKKGGISIQFPIYQTIRTDKTDVSYF